jgi:hypothetical protein
MFFFIYKNILKSTTKYTPYMFGKINIMHQIPLWKAQLIIAATEDGKKKNHSNSV